MFLHIKNKPSFLDLHLTTRLHDWDMNEELRLATTTDQVYPVDGRSEQYLAQWHCTRISRRTSAAGSDPLIQDPADSEDSEIQPCLWLVVNPSIVCPINYPPEPSPPKLCMMDTPVPSPSSPTPVQNLHLLPLPDQTCLGESPRDTSLSSEDQVTDEDVSSADAALCRKVQGARKGKAPKAPSSLQLRRAQSRRLQRAMQDICGLKMGVWPRPPVNYCILIAMALSSSRTGSLNVQQIYNFTREHFPFFLTAPDGWKNTIRHNLCFSDSFKKTPQQDSGDGKRKSCLWRLTLDGRRRLRNEIHTLTADSFMMLKNSMNYPEKIEALFRL